jgi:hypothetical protein
MKKLIFSFLMSMAVLFSVKAIPPYYSLGTKSGSITDVSSLIKENLVNAGFEILGEYQPGNNSNLYVIVYGNSKLSASALRVKDRGMLGSVLKVGLVKEANSVKISMLNPDYMFYGYFREAMENTSLKASLDAISQDAKNTLKAINGKLEGFGGDESVDDLTNYHYMMGMPYFDDPVELAEFGSFEEGLKIIKKNLENKAGGTLKVYEMVNEAKKVAVFGVGLMDPKVGEAHFLPIIGEDHLAALPYEIILVNNEASMLHGRFRFALYWPELTMGTFTKIMSTPGDVEETMEKLCK